MHEAIVNLSAGQVESNVRLGPNVHSGADSEELVAVELIALEDEGVKAAIAKLQLPEGTVVVCDPWIYGRFTTAILNESCTDNSQVPMGLTRDFLLMINAISNVSFTFETQRTLMRWMVTITPCLLPFLLS